LPILFGERLGSMENSSSSASTSDRRAWPSIWSSDKTRRPKMFVGPTISFRLLYGLLIMGHGRRLNLGLGSQRIQPPNRSQIRSGTHAVRTISFVTGTALMVRFYPQAPIDGIRDRTTSPRSPQQNGYAERQIGSVRRECLDHVAIVALVFRLVMSTATTK
jgi:transposase InsO family protein